MKSTRIIMLGVVLLSALTITSCGPKKEKVAAEAEKKECCEKKDTTKSCCGEMKDSTACEKKCAGEAAKADTKK